MQNSGLEWLFRFSQEPTRLWRRYLYHNPRFIALAMMQLTGLCVFDTW
jgi:UDP-N-acetyl-D-mannosaminuronic acid transferase (WecB/TagA/CpsF family)